MLAAYAVAVTIFGQAHSTIRDITGSGMSTVIRNNKRFLATLAQASQTLSVTVADDIRDAHGVKLISKGQQLTSEMQTRLAERELSCPLETGVCIDGGVTTHDIAHVAASLCQRSGFLATIVGAHFAAIKRTYLALPLQPIVHLMLSVQQVASPGHFTHAVLCSLIAGALASRQGGPEDNTRLAMLAGLIHDLGEMYGEPDDKTLIAGASRDRWREIVAHVEAGKVLIEQFTDYPESIVRAVFEHHERLDGSGYPRGISDDQVSPLGRVLGLADTLCGVIHAPDNHGARAKLAMSFVPGEFDPSLVRLLTAAFAGTVAVDVALPSSFDVNAAFVRADRMGRCLEDARQTIMALAAAQLDDPQMAEIVVIAQHRIERLKSSWDATGIDAYCAAEQNTDTPLKIDEESYFDLDVVSRELTWRMRSLSRHLVYLRHQYRLDGYGALEPVIAALEMRS
ncbi:MAG: hypothetical protein CVV14_04630 [Gammaproteobacteria bacterium HGW-Gammaproteobacteria-4]|jgi:HD-GYP domain-containing protein (c-di-GMP phosphodiesterase class II)|nr:MAG: hypothetical protein CVV14_04630 [Gammaproteobacteria bacterium HGW-Gammaproteobacteria-4]